VLLEQVAVVEPELATVLEHLLLAFAMTQLTWNLSIHLLVENSQ
jgi:hypothetical protein